MPRPLFVSVMLAGMFWLASPAYAEATLYVRLGGTPVLTRVVQSTIEALVHDPEANRSFDKVNLKNLNKKLVEQLCALTGGGCVYTGDDMSRVHRDLRISESEFYALVAALRVALDAEAVGAREKNELLRILAPMKRLVVTP